MHIFMNMFGNRSIARHHRECYYPYVILHITYLFELELCANELVIGGGVGWSYDRRRRNCFDEGRMDPVTLDPVNRIFLALCSRSQPLVLSHRLVSTVRCSLPKYVFLSTVTGRQFTMLALLLCGDIQLNPGPSGDKYPCGYCGSNVTWSRPAVACGECSVWYHKSCYSMSDSKYDRLADEPWVCRKCETSNSSVRTFHSYELDSEHVIHMESECNSNVFHSNSSIPSPAPFKPQHHSTPVPKNSGSAPTEAHSCHLPRSINLGSASDSLPVKGRNWRTLVLNANSIAGKPAEFACLVDYTKPDVIIMTETKLGESAHFSSEFMPPGYFSTHTEG